MKTGTKLICIRNFGDSNLQIKEGDIVTIKSLSPDDFILEIANGIFTPFCVNKSFIDTFFKIDNRKEKLKRILK